MSNKIGKRRKAEEKIDISDLQFGDDFKDAEAMLNAEVKVRNHYSTSIFVLLIVFYIACLQAVIDTVNATQQLEFDDMTEMMQNTSKFVETFGKFQVRKNRTTFLCFL